MARDPTRLTTISPMLVDKQIVEKEDGRHTKLSSQANIYASMTTAHSDEIDLTKPAH